MLSLVLLSAHNLIKGWSARVLADHFFCRSFTNVLQNFESLPKIHLNIK